MKNIMIINFNDDFLLKFVHEVAIVENIKIDSIFTDIKKLSNKFLTQLNYKDVYDFYSFDKIVELNNDSEYVLSKEDIECFYFLESEFLAESDRMSYVPISVKKRKIIYYEILQYWINYFLQNKIDLVVFDGVPHMGWDLICYEVAKKFKIQVCYLELTIIQDQVIWHDEYKSFKKNHLPVSSLNIEEIKNSIGKEKLLKYNVEGELLKLGKKLNEIKTQKTFLNLSKYKILLLSFYRFIKKIKENALLKDSSFFYSKPTLLQYLFYNMKNKNYLYKLNKQYEELSDSIDLDKKFIFFAMHYQPERTTSPQGECFQEQILAIKIISASLPENWILYVKEHPTQMINRKVFKNKNFRDYYDYKIIKQLKNVKLVPLSVDSAIIIEKAQLVATINGSIGWETLIQYKKPVAIFGNIWYAQCRSCFSISSTEDFKDVLKLLKEHTPNEVEKNTLNLLKYYSDKFCISSDGDFYANYSSLSKDELIKNLVNKFIQEYID
ncbi:MAG: hypothetical protein CL623_00365 [Arcobacter sp.]|nr:hypothetical protein [Arcobacter sp.]|tara:strand:+ start:14406 stop:15890 length:1485 start_codon:yes stop_codon:yes gene_type:complete